MCGKIIIINKFQIQLLCKCTWHYIKKASVPGKSYYGRYSWLEAGTKKHVDIIRKDV